MSALPSRVWTDAEWERIQLGYRAQDMDEKWNVFAEDRVVFLHRSWTGYGIYEASFAPVLGGGFQITQAVVESDPERHRNIGDAYACLMLELVISAIVLGEPAAELRGRLVELTARISGKTDLPAGVVQHSALGLRTEP
ncbi:hypothetical protein [Streptomyces melanogenes]|uniref:hypothetical protein n=1 Tax=Streptomyces melanogenes TaxID=67326 RepID=UPI00379B30F0